jgi:hypothetical protein
MLQSAMTIQRQKIGEAIDSGAGNANPAREHLGSFNQLRAIPKK